LCKKCDDIITCAGSGHHLCPDRIDRIIKEMPGSVASGTHCINTYIRYCLSAVSTVQIGDALSNRQKV